VPLPGALAWPLAPWALAFALTACGRGSERTPPTPALREAGAPAADDPEPAAQPPAPRPPLGEAAARALLAGALREAGLRILHDVRVQGPGYDITLDGWDPARRVGFEYIAPEEVDTDLAASEREALTAATDLHVLILDAADHPTIESRLATFVASLGAP